MKMRFISRRYFSGLNIQFVFVSTKLKNIISKKKKTQVFVFIAAVVNADELVLILNEKISTT